MSDTTTLKLYLVLTPAGVLEAFASRQSNEMQLALQSIVAQRQSPSSDDWVEQFSMQMLQKALKYQWVECVDAPLEAPDLPLDDFLPNVVWSLSGTRKAAIASEEGFCLAYMGYKQQEAEMLCVAAGDFASFLQRQQQRGWHSQARAVSFFNHVDLLMPATSLLLLWIDQQGYIFIVDGEPLMNNRAFVELIWAIKTSGLKFQVNS